MGGENGPRSFEIGMDEMVAGVVVFGDAGGRDRAIEAGEAGGRGHGLGRASIKVVTGGGVGFGISGVINCEIANREVGVGGAGGGDVDPERVKTAPLVATSGVL